MMKSNGCQYSVEQITAATINNKGIMITVAIPDNPIEAIIHVQDENDGGGLYARIAYPNSNREDDVMRHARLSDINNRAWLIIHNKISGDGIRYANRTEN